MDIQLPKSEPPRNSFAKTEPQRLGFTFWPKPHHLHALVNPHLPAPQPRLTRPQISPLYPLKRPPTICSQKPSPSGSVFTFWPKSPHPHTLVNPHLPAPQPQLTPPHICPLYLNQ